MRTWHRHSQEELPPHGECEAGEVVLNGGQAHALVAVRFCLLHVVLMKAMPGAVVHLHVRCNIPQEQVQEDHR